MEEISSKKFQISLIFTINAQAVGVNYMLF
jgi:hypothetical protein